MDNILLIDFANMAHRSNVSWGAKEKSEDVIIYNFFRNLRPLVEMFEPHKLFFVLEGHPKHRYDLLPSYKSNRIVKTAEKQEKKDKFFIKQGQILDLASHMPITFAKADDYECDDVIAALANNLKDEKIDIISNDSDFIQLLQLNYSNCRVYNPIKKQFMESPEYHYLTFKSLNGDTSDKIPGIVSEDVAIELASNPDKLSSWLSIEENRSNFSINKQLVEFASVPEEQIQISEGVRDFAILKQEFAKLKFNSLLNEKTWEKFVETFDCIKY